MVVRCFTPSGQAVSAAFLAGCNFSHPSEGNSSYRSLAKVVEKSLYKLPKELAKAIIARE